MWGVPFPDIFIYFHIIKHQRYLKWTASALTLSVSLLFFATPEVIENERRSHVKTAGQHQALYLELEEIHIHENISPIWEEEKKFVRSPWKFGSKE